MPPVSTPVSLESPLWSFLTGAWADRPVQPMGGGSWACLEAASSLCTTQPSGDRKTTLSWNWPTAPGWVLQFGIHHSPLHALHPRDSAEFAYLIYRSKGSQSTSFSAALWGQDLGMEGSLGRSLLSPSSPCSSLPALWWELPQSFKKKTLSSKGLSTLLF